MLRLLYPLKRHYRQLLLTFVFFLAFRYPVVLSSTRLHIYYVGSRDYSCVPEMYKPVVEELKDMGLLREGFPADK